MRTAKNDTILVKFAILKHKPFCVFSNESRIWKIHKKFNWNQTTPTIKTCTDGIKKQNNAATCTTAVINSDIFCKAARRGKNIYIWIKTG